MKRFSRLFAELDATTSTNVRVAAMAEYFTTAAPADGAWAVYLLSGRRMKRLISASQLKRCLAEATDLPDWLIEETHQHVGDLAETIALLTEADAPDDHRDANAPLHRWIEAHITPLADLDDHTRSRRVQTAWASLPRSSCFLYNKLLTGSLRVGVSQSLVERALAEASGQSRAVIAHRLTGPWRPTAAFYRGLFAEETAGEHEFRPYPFFLAHPLQQAPSTDTLGAPGDWLVEWKWDGIRAQLVRRGDGVYLWSRGEELINEQFPELERAAEALRAGQVLDGEILAWRDGVLPFGELQRRLGRKAPGARILAEVPTVFLAYDVLEDEGRDVRAEPQSRRRERLAALLGGDHDRLKLSPTVDATDWPSLAMLRERARERRVEGLMLKRRDAAYGTGRPRGVWWKWKVDPLTVDAVLLYAQPGRGRRANLYTDYTFAVPDGEALVPIAKAYSGLSDAEIRRLDRWIRRHTRERFGPVRSVEPLQVFELAFEGLQPSRRHKSGVALRFPRIARWREDLAPTDADTLTAVRALLEADGG